MSAEIDVRTERAVASVGTWRDDARDWMRLWLWIATFVASMVVFAAAAEVFGDYGRGYFIGNDFVVDAILAGLYFVGFLTTCLIISLALRLRTGWTHFVGPFVCVSLAFAGAFGSIELYFQHQVDVCIARANAVVEAIKAYESKHGRSPRGLAELYPEFIGTREPEKLLEFDPILGFYPPFPSDAPSAGQWSLRTFDFLNPIHLEYVGSLEPRPLSGTERRVGDWIVAARQF